jgi:hypothetical protein
MAIGDALVAPTGVQNQMVGQPSRMPDPIGQQFMRQMQSPMGQQFQAQYEATQAPMREAEMAKRAEEQAAQDARFQEMMDRIAELEGQLAQPEPMPEPSPYIPGQTPFPGIPDFIRDLDFSNIDFSNIPGLSNFDYDDIMRQYNDRMEMGEPEPIESFLPDPRDFPPMGLNPPPGGFDGREPRFTTMPVGPRGPGMSIEDLLERVTTMPVEEPEPAPVMPRISMPGLPDFNFNTSNIPAPESFSESPYFMPGSGMGRIGQGVATDRESLIGKKIFGQTITPESFAGRETARSPFLRATPRPDLPTPNISGPFGFIKNSPSIDERPMIPNFGNINLR